MNDYFKICAGVMVTIILALTLQKQGKDISLLLICIACMMVLVAALKFLSPIIDLLRTLKNVSGMNGELFAILLKAVGMGLLGEITQSICNDSGHSALGKSIGILTTVLILWICLPLFTQLLELVQSVLGAL